MSRTAWRLRLRGGMRTHGAELVGDLVEYQHEQGDPGVEDSYRLCYVRGPEGIIVGLAEQLS